MYRDFIYFFASEADREQFFINSTALLSQPAPPVSVPIRIAIAGPPKSGKSSLTKALCDKFGCVRVTIGSALRAVMEQHAELELATLINDHLCTGDRVPDELCIEAVKLMISSSQARVCGYVFDGFPVSKEQVELLNERLIIPSDFVFLSIDARTAIARNIAEHKIDDPSLVCLFAPWL